MADLFVLGGGGGAVLDGEGRPPDWEAREQALGTQQSWIVEAPAGSGKTGLLIQRYLKLLGDESVTDPQEVLAITFTVKATAEIRDRLLEQLEGASRQTALKTGDEFARETRRLAEAVLERDRLLGWGLLDDPQRMHLRTIDGVCVLVASSLPVLAGGGGQQTPVLDARRLYGAAARRTVLLLGGSDATLSDALRTVLLHRDGNLAECERLLAEMLAVRDQWGELIPLQPGELDETYLEETVLPQLKRALELAVLAGLRPLAEGMPKPFVREAMAMAASLAGLEPYMAEVNPLAACADGRMPGDEAEDAQARWRGLIHLLVTPSSGTWRKSFAKNTIKFESTSAQKKQMAALVDQVRDRNDLLGLIERVLKLPPAAYPMEQWEVAKALFRMLSRALVELQLVFAERGECDLVEVGLRARTALRNDQGPADLESALGTKLRHLLVDEMQDTSTSQYELIERLTQSWDGQSQTVFLVGDPKQSIYLFRQARVERFLRTMREERLGEMRVKSLRLTANFRSQGGLVEEFNTAFSLLFPKVSEMADVDEIPYAPAEAVRERVRGGEAAPNGVMWHIHPLSSTGAGGGSAMSRKEQRREEAETVRQIVQDWRARALPTQRKERNEPWRIAVLVRGRSHLREIVAALQRDDGEGAVPFRAVEIDALGDRPEVLDLTSLTRALLHGADRTAWLAVLRAPWCGLTLEDLHQLAGGDDTEFVERAIERLIEERGHLLSDDGCTRLMRVWPVLQAARAKRARLTTAQLVERTWRSLGGDAYLSTAERGNAERYFELLDEIEAEGEEIDAGLLQQRLGKLYAEAETSPEAVELLTIHKAKGLEWDVVLVPGLERKAPSGEKQLLTWNEIDQEDKTAAAVVLAPIAGKGEASQALNDWLRSVQSVREAAERKRLFYVLCTRAREELHLFAAPKQKDDGSIVVEPNSLLKAAWPAAERHLPERGPVLLTPMPEESGVVALAAEAGVELRTGVRLQRLPAGFDAKARLVGEGLGAERRWSGDEDGLGERASFVRPEGSFAARSFGNAVHGFLELAAKRMSQGAQAEELLAEMDGWEPRMHAVLRGDGLPPGLVERQAGRVRVAVERTLRDAVGRWMLEAHAEGATEFALTTWRERRSSVRVDRLFRAGFEPLADGTDCLWIVDYKTTTPGGDAVEEFLQAQRAKYGPQLEGYARALASRGAEIRVGLYYPLLAEMVWWKPTTMSAAD